MLKHVMGLPGALALTLVIFAWWAAKMQAILYPLTFLDDEVLVDAWQPLWGGEDELVMRAYLSTSDACPKFTSKPKRVQKGRILLVDEKRAFMRPEGYIFDAVVNVSLADMDKANLKFADAKAVDIFVVYCLGSAQSPATVMPASVRLVSVAEVPRYRRERWLLEDVGLGHLSHAEKRAADAPPAFYTEGTVRKLVRTDVVLRLTSDRDMLVPHPHRVFLPSLHPHLRVHRSNPADPHEVIRYYLPPMYAHVQGTNAERGSVLVEDIVYAKKDLSLKLGIKSSELSRWLLANHMESTKKVSVQMGMDGQQMTEMIEGFVECSIPFLAVTIFATFLHCVFDMFAFKSDVTFWKNNTSLVGLSTRSLFIDLVFQVVIILYMQNERATLVLLLPSYLWVVAQVWKIRKATGLTFVSAFPYYRLARVEDEGSESSSLVKATLDTDRAVMKYIVRLLGPVVVGWTLYSLVYRKHESWWFWIVNSLASFVYGAGFLLMTPQVMINYKLQSVAHMPWEVLSYKFLNTFIDDLFALIVEMPDMHKMSVFRDDIVFVICIVQRFLYRVDTKRKEHAD